MHEGSDMNIYFKILSYLLFAAAIISGLWWYGSSKYDDGYEKAMLEGQAAVAVLEKKYRQQEADAAAESRKKYDKALEEKRKTDDANVVLDTTVGSLRNQVALYKRRLPEASGNPTGTASTGEVGLDVFLSCTEQYSGMAQEAGRLADKVNALQDQVSK